MRRLKLLEEYKYIKASPLLYRGKRVYWLQKEGLNMIYNTDEKIVKRELSALIPHYLSCGEFYFALKDKAEVETYDTEFDVTFQYNSQQINFRPDILVQTMGYNYLVEIDNKQQKYLISKKVKNYEDFSNSNEDRKYFDKYPRVLIISNAAEKFKTKIEEIKKLPINYFLTEFDKLDNIEKDVWLKVDKKERCRIWD
jgi:hypothetical protein